MRLVEELEMQSSRSRKYRTQDHNTVLMTRSMTQDHNLRPRILAAACKELNEHCKAVASYEQGYAKRCHQYHSTACKVWHSMQRVGTLSGLSTPSRIRLHCAGAAVAGQ